MSGIFPGDAIIKAAIELGIEDMRKNLWLIDHMLEDLVANPYLKEKFGQKQVDACKEWFVNNQIDVCLRPRDDKDRLPCITIEMGSSNEKSEMKSMADQSTESVMLLPNQINKPIPYVLKPFVPVSYDEDTGEISVSDNVDVGSVAPGMILVNPSNGNGYIIQSVGPNTIVIEADQEIDAAQFGVVPKYQYYEARIEHSFFDESYTIGCHAHGDVQPVLWLWSITKYSILRYRESLLEANGFAESSVNSGPPDLNVEFTTQGGEKAYTRTLVIHGQIENSWIKSPRRIIEVVALKDRISRKAYNGGIKILSNLDTPSFIDKSQEVWNTVNSSDDEEND